MLSGGYILSSQRLYDTEGESSYQLRLRCREVLAKGGRSLEVLGPAIADEALSAFTGFWEKEDSLRINQSAKGKE